MRKLACVVVFLMTISLFAIGCQPDADAIKIMPSEADYSAVLDTNTPEGLAQESSKIYQSMLSGEMEIKSGFDKLLTISSEKSVISLIAYEEEFSRQIEATKEYFQSEGTEIERYEFACTEYPDSQTATIKRIQVLENGKKYYFSQDFVLENGIWRIKGDNLENDFVIMRKFLFWYI